MHLAVKALGKPVQQGRLGVLQVNACDRNLRKSQLLSPLLYFLKQSMTIHPPIFWHREQDTEAFAQQLVQTHDLRHAVVDLRGDLGAGKTTLARYLLRALGVQGSIKSPTYTLVETYTGQGLAGDWWDGLAIAHFDFYRFSDPHEWEDAGFRDIFAAPGLKLVEWADLAKPMLPAADLVIAITLQGDGTRQVQLSDACVAP